MLDSLMVRVLRYLPKNLISRVFGWFARRQRPRVMVRLINRWWAAHFDVALEAADRPLADYPSLLAFFTRGLRAGIRPVVEGELELASPVDAAIGAFGRMERDVLIQAKGMEYRLGALLGSERAAHPFLGGHYATFYLSPRDYHRIHAPREGVIASTLYEPGTLYPVNTAAVRIVPALFAVNERVATILATDRGPIAVVMVGATNVGSIRVSYADLVTNRGRPRQEIRHEPPIAIGRGDHLGTFELGSTVVLVVSDPEFRWQLREGEWLPMGAQIGRFGA